MPSPIQIRTVYSDSGTAAGLSKASSGLGGVATSAENATKRTSGLATGFKALAGGALLLGAAKGVKDFLGGAIEEGREAQKVGAQTVATLKATHGAANITNTGIQNLAGSISRKTGIDDEQIQSQANLVLGFKNVRNEAGKGNDIFNRTVKAANDYSVATGTAGPAASKKFAKALSDPAKGMNLLRSAGVEFTDQQKAQITQMVKSGNTLGAQKILLKGLEDRYKGSAAAQATTGDKFKVMVGNIQEAVGGFLLPLLDKAGQYFLVKIPQWGATAANGFNGVKTAFEQGYDAIEPVITFLAKNPETVKAFAITLGILAGVLGVVALATAAWNAVLAINPIFLVVIAIAALVAGLVYAYKNFDTFRAIVDTAFSFLKSAASVVLPIVGALFRTTFAIASAVVRTAFDVIVGSVRFGVNTVQAVIGGIVAVVTTVRSAFENARSAISEKLDAGVSLVRGLPGRITGALAGAGSLLLNIGRDIINGLINGIDEKIETVKAKLKNLTDLIPKIKGPASKDRTLLTNNGRLIIGSLVDGFRQEYPSVLRSLSQLTNDVAGFTPTLTGAVAVSTTGDPTRGGSVTINLRIDARPGATVNGAQIGADLVDYLEDYYNSGGRKRP